MYSYNFNFSSSAELATGALLLLATLAAALTVFV